MGGKKLPNCCRRQTPPDPCLNARQQAELDFYLRDYMKDLPPGEAGTFGTSWLWLGGKNKRFDVFYYRDSLFQMTVNPILGSDLWVNQNGSFYHWWNGVEASSTIGRFAIWASTEGQPRVDRTNGQGFPEPADRRIQHQGICRWKKGLLGSACRDYLWMELGTCGTDHGPVCLGGEQCRSQYFLRANSILSQTGAGHGSGSLVPVHLCTWITGF